MCTDVRVVVPRDADLKAISTWSDDLKVAHGLAGDGQKWDGDLLFGLFPRDRCFCGTSLGSVEPKPEHHADAAHRERVRKTLLKKGWGDAKIERWFAEAKKQNARREVEYEQRVARKDPFTEHWRTFLRGVIERGYANHIGIVVTEPESEPIRHGKSIRAANLTTGDLERMRESEVLTVTGG